jgi:hypothetical protein
MRSPPALRRELRARTPRQRPGIPTVVISPVAHPLPPRPVAPVTRVQTKPTPSRRPTSEPRSTHRTRTVKSRAEQHHHDDERRQASNLRSRLRTPGHVIDPARPAAASVGTASAVSAQAAECAFSPIRVRAGTCPSLGGRPLPTRVVRAAVEPSRNPRGPSGRRPTTTHSRCAGSQTSVRQPPGRPVGSRLAGRTGWRSLWLGLVSPPWRPIKSSGCRGAGRSPAFPRRSCLRGGRILQNSLRVAPLE